MPQVRSFSVSRRFAIVVLQGISLLSAIAAGRVLAQDPPSPASGQDPVQTAANPLPGTIYVQANYERRGDHGEVEKKQGVIAIDPNTGDYKELGQIGHSIRVSPDGKRYAASQQGAQVNGEQASDIHVYEGTTFETLHVVENASRPAWSGDGKRVVYNVGKMGDDVGWRGKASAVDVTTKEIRELQIPETDEVDDWSVDGDWLVTVSDRHPPFGSGYQLYVMHSDGTDQRRLTEGRGLNCYPRFHPKTNQVVYNHQQRGVDSLCVVDIDGKNRREIMKSHDHRGAPNGACWSPDGKWLVVARFDWSVDANGKAFLSDPALANHRLEIIAPDGASRGVLTLAEGSKIIWLGHPDWR